MISKRSEAALHIANLKKPDSDPYRPEREAQVLQRITELNNGPLSDEEMAREYKKYQQKLKKEEASEGEYDQNWNIPRIPEFYNGNNFCQIDYPKIIQSKFTGGFFAIFVPDSDPDDDFFNRMNQNEYDFPLPSPISTEFALDSTMSMVDILKKIETNSKNNIEICTSGNQLNKCIMDNKIGVILHIEGAECIDENFKNLDKLYNLGLRSIGLVWSRNNIFASGVPFSFPSSPDRGNGLTELGKQLVKICDDKNILIDLSHINLKGFYDVAKYSSKPLIATHSNAHFITNHSRNLTDEIMKLLRCKLGCKTPAEIKETYCRSKDRFLAFIIAKVKQDLTQWIRRMCMYKKGLVYLSMEMSLPKDWETLYLTGDKEIGLKPNPYDHFAPLSTIWGCGNTSTFNGAPQCDSSSEETSGRGNSSGNGSTTSSSGTSTRENYNSSVNNQQCMLSFDNTLEDTDAFVPTDYVNVNTNTHTTSTDNRTWNWGRV